jgi:hypothetical protein
MITALHEGLVGITTLDTDETARMLRTLFGLPLQHTSDARIISPDLSECSPSVYRADAAVLYSVRGEKFAVITEVQLQPDDDKHLTWPAYLANLRVRDRCQACLVVICPDRATARWAAQGIETGHPGHTLYPLVIGPDNTPVIIEVAEAIGNIGLAAVAAITHGKDPQIKAILATLVEALDSIDPEKAHRYAEYVTVALTGDAQEEMERLMATDTYVYQGKYAQSLIAEGEAKGVLLVLESRGVPVSEAERERIAGCTDIATLEMWLQRAALVDSVDKLFS